VPRDAHAVRPRVTGVAAREQEAVVRERVRDRELGAPPDVRVGLFVDERLGTARLAVALVAHDDAVGGLGLRHAQPDDGRVAHLRGPLQHVQVGAVVVR
jgi:hypothetical protein